MLKKCLSSELFWPVFSRIWTENGEISSYQYLFLSARMRENAYQNNSNTDTFHTMNNLSWEDLQ